MYSKKFFISDSHFDHKRVIYRAGRPFHSVEAMNLEMFERWNDTVHPQDTVYFLGDLTHGRNTRGMDYWLERLHGEIILMKGNHDRNCSKQVKQSMHSDLKIKHEDTEFFLCHKPTMHLNPMFKGWYVHGHKHNYNTGDFPFINGNTRRINVGAELINYEPLCIDDLLALDLEKISFQYDLESKPEFKKEFDTVSM